MSKKYQKLAQMIINNHKPHSLLSLLLKYIKKDAPSVEAILACEVVVCRQLEAKKFSAPRKYAKPDYTDFKKDDNLAKWLEAFYSDSIIVLLNLTHNQSKPVAVQALKTLMACLCAEILSQGSNGFPFLLLKMIVKEILQADKNKINLFMPIYQTHIQQANIAYYTWIALKDLVGSFPVLHDQTVLNLIAIINITPIENLLKEAELTEPMEEDQETGNFVINKELLLKCVSQIWKCITNRSYPVLMYRDILAMLLEKLMPHMKDPILLTDFLMSCLSLGGAVSLLALQGISILMQKNNLECPNVYKKLYSLFEPDIFRVKYKARLFYLADMFFSSSHIPETLVASFIKRVCNLALSGEAHDVRIMLYFVGNLLIRFPSLKQMYQRAPADDGDSVACDPYDRFEADPLKTRAIESSVWEIQLLKQHVNPVISSAAKFIDSPLPEVEWDLATVLDESSDNMFEREKKKKSDVSLTFIKPRSLSQLTDDRLYKFWDLS